MFSAIKRQIEEIKRNHGIPEMLMLVLLGSGFVIYYLIAGSF